MKLFLILISVPKNLVWEIRFLLSHTAVLALALQWLKVSRMTNF